MAATATKSAENPITETRVCPTCGAKTTFTLLGEQVWPSAVADKMNMPRVVHLWQCGNCDTTITGK